MWFLLQLPCFYPQTGHLLLFFLVYYQVSFYMRKQNCEMCNLQSIVKSILKCSKLIPLLRLCTLAWFPASKKPFRSQLSCASPSDMQLLLLIAALANGHSPTSLGSKWLYAELGPTEWFSTTCRIQFYESFKKQLLFFPCAATFITRWVYCTYNSKSVKIHRKCKKLLQLGFRASETKLGRDCT